MFPMTRVLRMPEGEGGGSSAATSPVTDAPSAPAATQQPAPQVAQSAPAAPAPQPPPQAKDSQALGATLLSATAKKPKTLAELLEEKGPDQAQKRIERGVRKALRAFGIDLDKDADITAEAEKYRADRSQKKSERRSLRTEAEKAGEKVKTLSEAVSAYAAIELGRLTEQEKSIVLGLAPSDPGKQLAHIAALRASGAIKTQPSTAAAQPAPANGSAQAPTPVAQAPIPQPSTSAPVQPGPVPLTPPAVDHLSAYRGLPKDGAARALYLIQHPELAAQLLQPPT